MPFNLYYFKVTLAVSLVFITFSVTAETNISNVSVYQANLRTCMGGYASLCKHGLLTADDAKQVKVAEYQANLRTCMGGYASLCKYGLLTADDTKFVRVAVDKSKSVSVRKRPISGYALPEFNGYPCTVDCSGHEAGYSWAEVNSIDDPYDCHGQSNSFVEGCQSYVEEQQLDDDSKEEQ